MSILTTPSQVPLRRYLHLTPDMLPFEHDGVYQLYLINKRVGPHECKLIGTHKGTNLTLQLDPVHRNTTIRVHDNNSYAVERFTVDGITSSALITDDGWHSYQSYEELENGNLRLTLLNDWEEEVTYDAFPEERLDRAFIGWYNSMVYARELETRLKDLLGLTRDVPVDIMISIAYDNPGARHLLNQYLESAQLISNAPNPRQ